MEAKVVAETDDYMIVEWAGPTGFGQLTVSYNGKGGYEVDAEYISMKTLKQIFKALDNGR